MKITHYIPAFTQMNADGQEAACGRFIPGTQHSPDPTCETCRAWFTMRATGDDIKPLRRSAVPPPTGTTISPAFAVPLTPIVRDMRRMAREVGIVDLLLEHQQVIYEQPAHAYDLVEEVLLRLGVTNKELADNLNLEPVIGPDPRD